MRIVFHAACIPQESFKLAHPHERETWRDVAPSADGWQPPSEDWMLPLYSYAQTLSDQLRPLLPRCLGEWEGEAPSEPLDGVAFEPPSVTLWTPGVVLVTLRAQAEPPTTAAGAVDRDALHDLLETTSKALLTGTSVLGTAARKAVADPAHEHPVIAAFAREEALSEPLWCFGTAYLPEGAEIGGEAKGEVKVDARGFGAIVAGDDDAAREFDLVMAVQNVVWGGAIDHDHAVLLEIADMRLARRQGVRVLEEQADKLMDLLYEVARFRGSVASMEVHIERSAYAYWAYMEEEWGLRSYLDVISAKADRVVQLHNELTTVITSRRASRLGKTAFAFTALGLVTMGVAVVSFVATDAHSWNLDRSDAVLVLVFLVGPALGIIYWGLREGELRRSAARARIPRLRARGRLGPGTPRP